MTFVVVDVEADGPCPGLYSMVSFGAVEIRRDGDLTNTFFGQTYPISEKYLPEALSICGITRAEHLSYRSPKDVMVDFARWLSYINKPIFISDNNGFDWQFINYYFHTFYDQGNPFGYSSMNINCLYKGIKYDLKARWKHLRDTKHTHHPVDDAIGNAEALCKMMPSICPRF